MKQVTLKIDGMRCGMCEAHVCDAIRRELPSAKKIKASHMKGTATFQIEESQDIQPVIERIESTGYRVLDCKTEEAKKGFFSRFS